VSELSIALPLPRSSSPNAVRRILAGNALSLLGDGLLLPFAALYFVRTYGFSAAAAGLVLTVMAGSAAVLTVPAGVVLDRLGARRATVGATVLQGVACVLLPFGGTLAAALGAAALFGAGRAVARPGVDAVLGELTEGEDGTAAFAAMNVAINVGFGAGAAIGGLLAGLDGGALRWLFVLDAATYLLFAVVLRGAPEVAVRSTERHGGYRDVLRDRTFLVVLAVGFLAFLALTQIDVGFSLFTVGVAHVSVGVVGAAGFANTLAVVAFQGLAVRRTAALSRRRVLALGGAALAACWALVALGAVGGIAGAAALVAALAAMGIGETLLMPVIFGLANTLAPQALRGRYNAALWAAFGAAFAIGPVGGGALIGAHLAWLWLALLGAAAVGLAALARGLGER
jgi:MFS family permease